MKMIRAMHWIDYNGTDKPTESISDARWAAMVKRILREFPDLGLTSDKITVK